jgi:predicted outer membrane protein
MSDRETPIEYKDKSQLIFVEQGWSDPTMINLKFKDWAYGRVDIRTWDDQYANNMVHFFTPTTEEWLAFVKRYSAKWVTDAELDEFTKTLKEKFYRTEEN